MEEKIVILGNGFDLRHFLPTSYNHLISILCEIEKLPEDKESISFSDLFDGVFKEKNVWFYNQINEYYQTENFIFDLEEIKSIQNRLEENSWFQYFKSVDENKIETWIDFEMEIERILSLILEYFESFNGNLFDRKPVYSSGNFFIPVLDSNLYSKNKIQFHILQYFYLVTLSPRLANAYINDKFILNIDREIQYYKERDFFNFIYESLEEFVGIFNDYLLNVVNVFYENFKDNKQKDFIRRDEKKIFDKVGKIYSFNYTDTYKHFYSISENDSTEKLLRWNIELDYLRTNQTEFLHGSIVESWKVSGTENIQNNLSNLKIVLGIDDIHDSLKKHKLFQFTKYFQKLHKQTDYLFLKDYQHTNKTKSQVKYIFYFWGHSLDYSDRQYVREVFDLVENSEGSKIKIFYHSISAKGDQLKNLLGIIEKEKIEKFMKFDTLEFIESTSENLFKEL